MLWCGEYLLWLLEVMLSVCRDRDFCRSDGEVSQRSVDLSQGPHPKHTTHMHTHTHKHTRRRSMAQKVAEKANVTVYSEKRPQFVEIKNSQA